MSSLSQVAVGNRGPKLEPFSASLPSSSMAYVQKLRFCNHSQGLQKMSNLPQKQLRCEEKVIRCKNMVSSESERKKRLQILIAGGGIGGLVLALAAKNRGFDVKVFERNLSAIRGEGRYRGPIQLQSNALAVLEAIDKDVAEQVIKAGCVTGNRINGLADGISGEWFTKFDLFTPAIERGLPVTQVICRATLQSILVDAVGLDIIYNMSNVVDFREDPGKVKAILSDGREYEGDILIGADGIWSKVRSKMFGWEDAEYSGYTCYSGLANCVPAYISTVGYRVFLGFGQYFVASDVGDGKMQWYAFHKEPSGNTDPPSGKKMRLLTLFESWCDEVVTLIEVTPEAMILRRDIYDRDMIYRWGKGRVTLLGDAAHVMQPNLGQGGCMAIEDCYQLILELDKALESTSYDKMSSDEIALALERYERKRLLRVSVIHTVARMASKMVSSYQPYLDFGSQQFFFLTKMRIPHPGLTGARLFVKLGLPRLMTWILTGHGGREKKLLKS